MYGGLKPVRVVPLYYQRCSSIRVGRRHRRFCILTTKGHTSVQARQMFGNEAAVVSERDSLSSLPAVQLFLEMESFRRFARHSTVLVRVGGRQQLT